MKITKQLSFFAHEFHKFSKPVTKYSKLFHKIYFLDKRVGNSTRVNTRPCTRQRRIDDDQKSLMNKIKIVRIPHKSYFL